MDLVDWSEETYNKIKSEIKDFVSKLAVKDIYFIPISAILGDNIVDESDNMPWYKGSTLKYLLENIHIGSDEDLIDCRFPIQYVIRPRDDKFHDYRGYAGKISSGIFKSGDKVRIIPSGFSTRIKKIHGSNGELQEAFPPMSVAIQLEDDFDISRGDMIVREENIPEIEQDLDLMICWMNNKKLQPGKKYIVRHTTKETKCIVKEIVYKLDINTLHRIQGATELGLNDIGRIKIRTAQPLFFDSYRKNRATGCLILIDEHTNETVAAGMIRD
jgi:sulfate adenylyltransferase subunit 1